MTGTASSTAAVTALIVGIERGDGVLVAGIRWSRSCAAERPRRGRGLRPSGQRLDASWMALSMSIVGELVA